MLDAVNVCEKAIWLVGKVKTPFIVYEAFIELSRVGHSAVEK